MKQIESFFLLHYKEVLSVVLIQAILLTKCCLGNLGYIEKKDLFHSNSIFSLLNPRGKVYHAFSE